tara:strand:+ start:989 stop:1750 length:762 start_codon:yes stop_codon:yes gene_type:complete
MEENKQSGEQRLIERVLKQRSAGSLMKEDLPGEASRRKLTDIQSIIDCAKEAVEEKLMESDKLEKCRENRNRTRIAEYQLPVANIVYNVTAPIWRNMVRSAVDGLGEDLHVKQPNARWRLCDADMTVIEKVHRISMGSDEATGRQLWEQENVSYLLLAFEYIDERGEKDLQYRDGRPLTGQRMDFEGLAPELAEAMARIVSDKQQSNPTDNMQKLMDQNATLMARLEALEAAATPKPRRGRKAKAATPEPEIN